MTTDNDILIRWLPWALGLGILVPPATAQGLVVPAQYDRQEAPNAVFWALSPFDARRQLLIDGGHLLPAQGRSLQGLSLRRNGGDPDAFAQGSLDLELHLSTTTRAARNASPVLAQNRGNGPRQVFLGRLDLPASPSPAAQPVPWTSPDVVKVPFQAPFSYAGGTLCLEAVTRGIAGAPTPWWPVDGVRHAWPGLVGNLGQSCVPRMPGTPAGADAAGQALGSSALVYLRGAREQGTGLMALGGGQSTALDLTPAGARGCSLYVDPAVLVPFALRKQGGGIHLNDHGHAMFELPVPWDTRLAGASYYTQWVIHDSGHNALGLTFSNAVRATLSVNTVDPGTAWVESMDPNGSRGRLLPGRMPVLRFDL